MTENEMEELKLLRKYLVEPEWDKRDALSKQILKLQKKNKAIQALKDLKTFIGGRLKGVSALNDFLNATDWKE